MNLHENCCVGRCITVSGYDKMHFRIIRFVHETLYGLFVSPYKRLNTAGLKQGQKVLEVGCGPGFFTIPAAKIVGDGGHVYAIDVNPVAVEHVRRKIERQGLKNVEVIRADAGETGLADESLDTAFLFAVIHAFPNVGEVMREMHRVLKTNGTLSVQSRWPERKLLDAVSANGLFHLREKADGVFKFQKDEPVIERDRT
jgi:ubiquinone/menaquinone biosynthesis C-methylase UbiE